MPIGGVMIGASLNEPERFINRLNNSALAWKSLAKNETFIDTIVSNREVANVVASNENAMNAIASSEIAMNVVVASEMMIHIVVSSEVAMNAITSSEIAMNEVGKSEVARNAIWNSELAWDKVKVSDMAVGKYVAGAAGLNPENYLNMDAVANSEGAMNAVVSKSEAMNAIVNSELASDIVASSEIAMDKVWHSNMARQKYWNSSIARLALWNHIDVLQSVVETSGPNLVSESQLNTDKDAGYLTYVSKSEGNGDWTAVDIDDGSKYIVFVHFYSYQASDWYQSKTASHDQTTDLRTINGGYNKERGGVSRTSNGLWVWFHDNASNSGSPGGSYARVWYIKV